MLIHSSAVSTVSTTILSNRPQHVDMATSYFLSMPPKSPYTMRIYLLISILISIIFCQIRMSYLLTNRPNTPGTSPLIFLRIKCSRTLLFERVCCINSCFSSIYRDDKNEWIILCKIRKFFSISYLQLCVNWPLPFAFAFLWPYAH